jgi:hypothetical protein
MKIDRGARFSFIRALSDIIFRHTVAPGWAANKEREDDRGEW